MDMSKSYRAAFEEYLPEVDIVFDRFHVMQIVNKAVDRVRKNQQKALDKEGIKTLKGGRFLPLWNFENLNPLKQERLKSMLEANEPLFIIHSMKEQLRLLWNQPNEEKARRFLSDWILEAISVVNEFAPLYGKSALAPLKGLAFTLMRHHRGILNYFRHFITNGKAEGINNKIKTLKRQAYGYRDMEYFKLRLHHLHKQKHQLVG